MPFAAGGPTDVVARLIGEHMGRTLGTTFVVENIGGAGGSIGMTRAALAQPDGYTIAVGNMGTQSAAPALYPNLKYDPAKSFAQIGITSYTPQAVVSKKALPTTTLKDFIAYVKGKGTSISYGHAGVGSIAHVSGLLFNAKFGLTPNMIPYRGTGPVLTDLVAVSEESADKLSPQELMTLVWVLIAAGFENITNLIGNTTRALVEHPAQRWALRQCMCSIPTEAGVGGRFSATRRDVHSAASPDWPKSRRVTSRIARRAFARR